MGREGESRLLGFFPRLRHGDSQPFSEMPKGFVLKQGLVRDFDKQTISHSPPDGT